MSQTINSDLIRGHINTIILKALYNGDRYGYEIIKDIEEKSHGQYVLKQPTLYSCLKRLESQGFISSYWSEEQTNGGRRKYYSLTDMGREVFVQNQGEYEYSRTIIDQLISEKEYDFSSEETNKTSISADEVVAEDELDEITFISPDTILAEDVTPEPVVDTINSEDQSPSVTNGSPQTSPSSLIDDLLSQHGNDSYSQSVKSNDASEDETFSYNQTPYASSTIFGSDFGTHYDDTPYYYEPEETLHEEQESDNVNDTTSEFTLEELAPTSTSVGAPQEAAFLKYNPEPTSANEPKTSFTNTHYRSALSELIDDFSNEPTQSEKLTKETIIAESSMPIREKIQVRNFGKLTEEVRELGDDVKIRTPDSNAVHAYNRQYLYYKNKLALVQLGIVFLIMLFETFLTFVIVKSVAKIHTEFDVALYVFAIIISVSLPIIAGINYLSEPFKRKRADFNLKHSIIFRIIIMLQLMLLTYAFNIFLEMPIGGSVNYIFPMLLPMILATNVPVSGLIFNALYKSKRFAVE